MSMSLPIVMLGLWTQALAATSTSMAIPLDVESVGRIARGPLSGFAYYPKGSVPPPQNHEVAAHLLAHDDNLIAVVSPSFSGQYRLGCTSVQQITTVDDGHGEVVGWLVPTPEAGLRVSTARVEAASIGRLVTRPLCGVDAVVAEVSPDVVLEVLGAVSR